MQVKTSQKIIWKTTALICVILLVCGIIINVVFFVDWYRRDTARVRRDIPMVGQMRQRIMGAIEIVDQSDPRIRDGARGRRNILVFEDSYYLGEEKQQGRIALLDVTRRVQAQYALGYVTASIVFLGILLSYFIARWFVLASLRNLYLLRDYVRDISVDRLDDQIVISGPPNDEIKMIADALTDALQKIAAHKDALQSFVTNASHELKTPLMMMQSTLDVASHTGFTQTTADDIQQDIFHINALLDNLLLITKIHAQEDIPLTSVDMIDILHTTSATMHSYYKNKEITIDIIAPDSCVWHGHDGMMRIIINNLLDNAYKYTPNRGHIDIQLTDTMLRVQDTGSGIKKEDIGNIFDRGRQLASPHTTTRYSFGVGLYLVKLLTAYQDHTIEVSSIVGEGTTFTLFHAVSS